MTKSKGKPFAKYYVLKEDDNDANVYLSNIPRNIKKQYQLIRGTSRTNNWPEDVVFKFSRRKPEGKTLTDWLENPSGWLIISSRLKFLLQKFKCEQIEYLPVKVVNHEGQVASNDYCIANIAALTEAVDRERSIFDQDPVDQDEIFTFDKLVLRKEIATSGPSIFRLKELPRLVLFREDLVKEINKMNLTGMMFIETSNYKSLDPDA